MDTNGGEINTTSAAVAAMNTRRFKIPGDTVNRATADLEDKHRSAIRWFHAYAAEHDLPMAELGRLIRYDETTVYRIFYGKYEGNLDNVCKQILDFKRINDERSQGRRLGFIETALARKIWKVCDAALEFQRIAFIIGETQTGKTAALTKYRDDHNHGSTVYVRCPTGGARHMFLAAVAKALRFSPQAKEKEVVRRAIESFDDRMLLIVDEIHQCVISGSSFRSAQTVEFIRELYDATRCGIVLCGTPVFEYEMDQGRFAGILKQCKRRRICRMRLPDIPAKEDMDTFAAAYGLPPADGDALKLQTEVVREEALGMWLCLLRMAAKLANRDGKRMTWRHVERAFAGLKTLEGI